MKTVKLSFMIATLFCSPANSQDICKGILEQLTNSSTSQLDVNYSKSVYDSHCEGSSSITSKNSNLGLDAIVKKIPVKFTGGKTTNNEKFQHFCTNFGDSTEYRDTSSFSTSRIEVRALEEFNNCIRLAFSGIEMYPTIGRDLVTIGIKGAAGEKLLHVRSAGGDMSCKIAGEDGKLTNTDNSLNLSLGSQKYHTVFCNRTPKENRNGTRHYGRTEIAIATTAAEPFVMVVPDENTVPEKWATDFRGQLKKLSDEIKSVDSKKPTLDCRTARVKSQRIQEKKQSHLIAVAMMPDSLGEEFFVTGGSCEVGSFDAGVSYLEYSKLTSDGRGWTCGTRPVPNTSRDWIRLIEAEVIYCRILSN